MRVVNVSVVISTDGIRTMAEADLIDFDSKAPEIAISGKGGAGREPGDKNRQWIGDNLATARALRSLAAHIERQARGAVKHAESVKAHRAEIEARKAASYDYAIPSVIDLPSNF